MRNNKATVTTKSGRVTPNGQLKTFVLKQGSKTVGEVDYWSWSYVSEQNAVEMVQQIAKWHNVTQIIWDNDN